MMLEVVLVENRSTTRERHVLGCAGAEKHPTRAEKDRRNRC
jgi:hypothetical protein